LKSGLQKRINPKKGEPMNPREQFEKETGMTTGIMFAHSVGFRDEYVLWLEKLVETLLSNPEPTREMTEIKLNIAIEALRKITFPIEYLQKEAEKAGGQLNGNTAMQLIKDSSFFQDITRAALKQINVISIPAKSPTREELVEQAEQFLVGKSLMEYLPELMADFHIKMNNNKV
jgi:hypothetical protein